MNQLVPILGDRAPALVVAADATRAIHDEMDHICHQIGPGGYKMQITAKSARQGRSAS
jgi:hypothetical protein